MDTVKTPSVTAQAAAASSAKIKGTQAKGQADRKNNDLQEVTDVITSLP
jgi:hypothetical protein